MLRTRIGIFHQIEPSVFTDICYKMFFKNLKESFLYFKLLLVVMIEWAFRRLCVKSCTDSWFCFVEGSVLAQDSAWISILETCGIRIRKEESDSGGKKEKLNRCPKLRLS